MAMFVFPSKMCLFFVILMGILRSSHARTFIVGGHDGWTLHPLEDYSHWAKRHRFQINDILVFKYERSHDSVFVVSKHDFLKCNKDNPIKILKDGDSKFKFTKSGPFFFISGHEQNCEIGQKMIVVVLSPHHHNNAQSAPSPSSSGTPLRPSSSPSRPSPPAHLSLPPTPSHDAPIISPSHPIVSAHFPSPSSNANTLSNYPSPSPMVENPSHIQPPSSFPAAKSPTYVQSLEPPSHSPSSIPAAITPTHAPASHSPSASPISHHSLSPMIPKAESPKNNINAPKPELQHQHHAPAPQSYPVATPPHHAPAPALPVVLDSGRSC